MLLDFKCPGTELSEFCSYGYTLRRGNLQSFRGRKEGRRAGNARLDRKSLLCLHFTPAAALAACTSNSLTLAVASQRTDRAKTYLFQQAKPH